MLTCDAVNGKAQNGQVLASLTRLCHIALHMRPLPTPSTRLT
jgi:hypothetical protein